MMKPKPPYFTHKKARLTGEDKDAREDQMQKEQEKTKSEMEPFSKGSHSLALASAEQPPPLVQKHRCLSAVEPSLPSAEDWDAMEEENGGCQFLSVQRHRSGILRGSPHAYDSFRRHSWEPGKVLEDDQDFDQRSMSLKGLAVDTMDSTSSSMEQLDEHPRGRRDPRRVPIIHDNDGMESLLFQDEDDVSRVRTQLMHQAKLKESTPCHRCHLGLQGQLWVQEHSQAADPVLQRECNPIQNRAKLTYPKTQTAYQKDPRLIWIEAQFMGPHPAHYLGQAPVQDSHCFIWIRYKREVELGIISVLMIPQPKPTNDLSQRFHVDVKEHGGQKGILRDSMAELPWRRATVLQHHLLESAGQDRSRRIQPYRTSPGSGCSSLSKSVSMSGIDSFPDADEISLYADVVELANSFGTSSCGQLDAITVEAEELVQPQREGTTLGRTFSFLKRMTGKSKAQKPAFGFEKGNVGEQAGSSVRLGSVLPKSTFALAGGSSVSGSLLTPLVFIVFLTVFLKE
ncbi:nucleoprotein [Varanus komodoensis]|nr:nucleoprotein [Varanus komodoensis]